MRLHVFFARNGAGLAVIAAAWLVFFAPVLFGGQVYFLDDLKILYYPIEHVYAQFQQMRQLPVWSNEFGFGHPLIAWGQLGFFTPLHVLLRLLRIHPLILLEISILTYFALGLLGMFVFLRRRNLSQVSAALGALVFVFSGFSIGHLNHVNFYTATMILPWLLWAIDVFVRKPTLARTALLALIAAAIPLSGQPQISLYTLIIAAIYGIVLFLFQLKRNKNNELGIMNKAATASRQGLIHNSLFIILQRASKPLILTIVAAVLFFSLSSFAILPLREFLPSTDRAGDLPPEELYEFSYPPRHAITLIFPYFFGDHTSYWGAKNFQELAAYTGIIPLLLAGSALVSWRRHRVERIWAAVLIAGSFLFVFGQYSPIYRALVESHVLSSLTVPGRFVYFFDVGIAILAALGLNQITQHRQGHRAGELLPALAGVAFTGLLMAASWWVIWQSASDTQRLVELAQLTRPTIWLITSGLVVFIIARLLAGLRGWAPAGMYVLTGLAGATLLVYGWNYNPLTPRAVALAPSPFIRVLQQHMQSENLPARIYAAQSLPVTGDTQVLIKPTEPLSPFFTVHQRLELLEGVSCLTIPLQSDGARGELTVTISSDFDSSPIVEKTLTAADVHQAPEQTVCIPQTSQARTVLISFASDGTGAFRLLYRAASPAEDGVYFVRVTDPTPEELLKSQKPLRIVINQQLPATLDNDQGLLLRHLHVTAGVSSARWIGALGAAQYRAFIEQFFANDREPFDGEGVHALARFRNLVNMAGITHLTQAIPLNATDDAMVEAGYELVESVPAGNVKLRLYRNPQAFPKAFMVRNAIWEPAPDQTRHAISNPTYQPSQLIYISGPKPPDRLPKPSPEPLPAAAHITAYQPTRIEVSVDTADDAWLVLSDLYTPEWHVSVDGEPADPYIANTVFRAVRVPAGNHTVRWEYRSPAIERSKTLTAGGLIISALLFATPLGKKLRRVQPSSQKPST